MASALGSSDPATLARAQSALVDPVVRAALDDCRQRGITLMQAVQEKPELAAHLQGGRGP